jgi:clan AA aspartic protease (TIGR02281 family)
MIRTTSAVCLGLSLTILGSVLPTIADDTATPADVLKTKGLKRSGDTFVLGSEAEVQKAVSEARAASKAVQQIQERKRQFEQNIRQGNDAIRELTEQRILLNRQLSETTSTFEHNQLVSRINEISDRLNLLQREVGDPEAGQSAGAAVALKRETFIEKVLKLRKLVDQTNEEYTAVAKDEEIKKALEALNKDNPRPARLGPSKAFLTNVRLLENVEKSVLTESVALRKEGGIFWLDVTFNGKVTKPMAFDTGASIVVLPYSMAKEVGLTPGKDAPTVQTRVADGTTTEAKKVVAPLLRVGKFSVKDVECIVMPPNKTDVPPLLGQTFQKHFSIKFDPEGRKLVLTKVEGGDQSSAPATTKTKATAKSKR